MANHTSFPFHIDEPHKVYFEKENAELLNSAFSRRNVKGKILGIFQNGRVRPKKTRFLRNSDKLNSGNFSKPIRWYKASRLSLLYLE